jgi:hypothetical protein
MSADDFDFPWRNTWFPLLDRNGDVLVCLDLNNLSLTTVDIECDRTKVIANCYEEYLDALVEIFEKEAYSIYSSTMWLHRNGGIGMG